MIRSIYLKNWRAYAKLDLELTRAVTFFVAPNGVGKTSLVEAVRWGLLGTPEDRDRGRAVRGDAESATVRLMLTLPGGTDIEVTRTLSRNGASTFVAKMNTDEIDQKQYQQMLHDSWGADTPLLDALIFGPTPIGRDSGFPIRDHLANIFGVTQLLDAASTVKSRRSDLADHIKSLRADLGGTHEAISTATEAVARLAAEVERAALARERTARLASEAGAQAQIATAWQAYRRDADLYGAQVNDVVARMSTTLGSRDLDPKSALEEVQRDGSAALEASLIAKADAQVRAAAATSAAQMLVNTPDDCPVCLRPLSAYELSRALAVHGQTDNEAQSDIVRRDEEAEAVRQRLAEVARFARALAHLRPPIEPQDADPGADAMVTLEVARQEMSDATVQFGAVTSQLQAAQAELATLREAAEDQIALVRSERENIVLGIAQRSLNEVATHCMTERIEPLAHEIGRRWKLVFGNDGLTFGTDGTLRLNHGVADIALRDFSGGERSTALLVTRLLLACSSTRASTMWLDEPLEHLDPRRRAAVAQTIVRAAQTGTVRQIVVTTYEEGLARRLAATAPDDVELTYALDISHD